MNSLKKGFIGLTSIVLLLSQVNAVGATETSFTSCLTPTGTIVANYPDGEHGIAGLGSKIGKDKVYTLQDGNSMQCFCATDGAGIQTNWLKVGNLTSDQIKIYENQGWIYIPTGASWGLSDEPYLAQNINYSCWSTTTTNDGRSDGKSDGKSDGLGSIVQAAHGSNLASTGNLLFIAEIFSVGVLLTLIGLFLRSRSN